MLQIHYSGLLQRSSVKLDFFCLLSHLLERYPIIFQPETYSKQLETESQDSVSIYSPVGEVFRARLRQFPSLVNCCTIDWFSAWPQEALQSVATSFLNELPELEASPTAIQSLVSKSV